MKRPRPGRSSSSARWRPPAFPRRPPGRSMPGPPLFWAAPPPHGGQGRAAALAPDLERRVDPYLKEGVLREGAMLTSAVGAYGQAVSEHMFATLLALCKRLHQYRDAQNRNSWTPLGEVKTLAGAPCWWRAPGTSVPPLPGWSRGWGRIRGAAPLPRAGRGGHRRDAPALRSRTSGCPRRTWWLWSPPQPGDRPAHGRPPHRAYETGRHPPQRRTGERRGLRRPGPGSGGGTSGGPVWM